MTDFTVGKPFKKILLFSLPMLAGSIFQQFYNMVDLIVVGNFEGVNALAAVGAASSVMFFIFSFVIGLTNGASVVVAQYLGAEDNKMVKRAIATSVIVLGVCAALLMIFGSVIARPLLRLMQTPELILDDAVVYLRVISLGIAATVAYNAIANIVRAFGDSITPLIFLIMACLLNIGLDLLFVIVFHMGVMGVALATIIAQACSAIACITCSGRKIEALRLKREDMVIDKKLILQVIKIGIPTSLQNSFVAIGSMTVQGIINSFGPSIIAAAAAGNKLNQFAIQPIMTLGMASATFTAQNAGAGEFERMKKGFRSSVALSVIFALCVTVLLFGFGRNLLMLFVETGEQVVLDAGTGYLRITSMFYFILGITVTLHSMLRGAGDVMVPLVCCIVEVPVRIVTAMLLSNMLGHDGIWWSGPAAWTISMLISLVRYLSGKWKEKALVQKDDPTAATPVMADF